MKRNKETVSNKRARSPGRSPLEGYKDIYKKELEELKKLTIARAARQTEILLKMAESWKK